MFYPFPVNMKYYFNVICRCGMCYWTIHAKIKCLKSSY